ncbi:MAG TPA: AbrB/MazE/SpoVT family DNA-binding domain-containing protein [Candidatus Methanoperedenaceae archaeon]|nr:AbrB/MazE/SpoVT family DNA-binding domain-containing protein [Candidatus Methanoperedenaceae archaeon]
MTAIICGKCRQEMWEVELPRYEFEEGIVLENVRGMRCSEGHVTFTEEQAQEMERRSEDIKKYAFRFVRSVSKSARSLVIRIPVDLAKHLDITENSKIEMVPMGKKKFMIEVK